MMKSMITEDVIRLLPKVDLHMHLDGSVKPETIMEFAGEQGIELPARDKTGLIPHMQVDGSCGSLKDYLSKFDFVVPFLQSGPALERVAYETVEQASEHNCAYIEVRFAPQLHRKNGLSAEETIHHVLKGLNRGWRQFGVKAKAIIICMRNHVHKDNIEVIEAAARYAGNGVAAVDLAGDEASYPAERFREIFALTRKKGMPVTIHAGEAAGPANIYEAIANLGASRIGHGVRLKENPQVLEFVKEKRIPLEMCPISNIQTKAVTGWEAYPIREYYDQGLLLTVNTDNPVVSGTNITKEFSVLTEKFGFTLRELGSLIMNGVEAAFMDESEKQMLKRDVRSRLSAQGAC